MIAKSFYQIPSLLIILSSLLACGGSSDSDIKQTSTQILRVNAGTDIVLNETETSVLTGGSSGGEGTVTYAWDVDTALSITHADTSLTSASIIAPSTTQVLTFSLTLSATDSVGNVENDTISLTVNPINIPPVAVVSVNSIPDYAVNSFPVASQIVLDGTASADPDAELTQIPIAAYVWQQIAGPGILGGIDTTTSSISLISPILNEPEQATFRLTVSDQEQASNSIDYTIMLLSQRQTLPTVNASAIRSVFSGELVALSGEGQSAAPDAKPFSAQWLVDSTAQINDSTVFDSFAVSPLVQENRTITYQLTATDSFRNTVTAQQSAQVFAPLVSTINDTGVSLFAHANSVSPQYQNDYPGQDGNYGADRQRLSGQNIKVGDGEQGFDFTRLNNNGDAVENANFAFSCVRDNVTALIWQIKDQKNTTSINFVEQSFTWYANEDNGNFAGDINDNSSSCNVQSGQCNTQAYIDQVNSEGLCGFYDWRLPAPNELQSIVHYGKATPPMVDEVFFPFWGGYETQTLWYWTSQSSADGVNNDVANNAWAYDMNSGNDGFLLKTTEQKVILVRAGR